MFEQPDLIPVNDSQYYLVRNYSYVYQDTRGKYRITVPTGFVTDIASVPRFAWTLAGILPDGLHRAAAVVHDFLYQWRGRLRPGCLEACLSNSTWVPSDRVFTRQDCDKIFLEAMKDAGAVPWKANAMYWAVRLFGGPAWDN
jgi:hypothetical protein